MNNRIWILGTVIACIAVVALGVTIGILPKMGEAAANTLNLAGVQAQNQAYQADLEALKVQYENIDDVRDQLEELQKTLPAEGEYPEFVDEIEQASIEVGVQILETGQTAPIVYGATSTADTGTAVTPINGGTLLAIPYTIKYNSTSLDSAFLFLDKLRTGKRLLLISSFDYESDPRNDVPVFEVFVTMYIYTLVDPATLPSAPANGAPPTDATATPAPTETPAP